MRLSKVFPLALALFLGLLGGIAAISTSAVAGPTPDDYVPANLRVIEAVKEFERTRTDTDYVALSRAIVDAGGDPIRFDAPRLGLYDLTPMEAQELHDEASQPSAAPTTRALTEGNLPSNTFSVDGYWSHAQDQYGEWWTYFSHWDFNDSYSDALDGGGGEPRDVMAVVTEHVNPSCWKQDRHDIWSYNKESSQRTTSLVTRYSWSFDSVIWQIDDSYMTGDTWYVDHGTAYISYQNIDTSCDGNFIYGTAYYEHNVDGCHCEWTASVTYEALNVSYTETQPDKVLRKSADPSSVATDEDPCYCDGGDNGGGGGDDGALHPNSVMMLYGYSSGLSSIHRFAPSGDSLVHTRPWESTGYQVARVGNRFVQGDFDGNGIQDVAAAYDYGSGAARIHVWLNGSNYQGGNGWWSTTSGYTLDAVAGRMAAGDFNGDGKDDIAMLYGYSTTEAHIHLFTSTGDGFNHTKPWQVASGYNVNRVGDRLAAGDFNGDGKDDLAAAYDYGSGAARIHVWLNGSNYQGGNKPWEVASGYHVSKTGDRLAAGDFDGNGKDDLVTAYDYGSGAARIHVWLNGANYQSGNGWWSTTSGYTLELVAGRMS